MTKKKTKKRKTRWKAGKTINRLSAVDLVFCLFGTLGNDDRKCAASQDNGVTA